jgi:NAD(P)-dependent dehydrogenase (short-subunit alcohol dehydrogenase family)
MLIIPSQIGYQVAIRLLRCGCTVHITTRFPKDAAMRYSKEQDFPTWKHNLKIHGLDLRDLNAVESFVKHMNQTLPQLHIIINNAAQTVRRNPQYYQHLIPLELLPVGQLPEEVREIIHPQQEISPYHSIENRNQDNPNTDYNEHNDSFRLKIADVGPVSSAGCN